MFQPIRNYFHHTFSSLKIRNYRLFFVGQILSQTGTWMQIIALSWLVLKLTGSGANLGLVIGFQYLPVLLVGPFSGVITDRFNRRKLLITAHSFSGVFAATLAILVATNSIELWMVYLLAALSGLANSIDNPARHALVQEMVGEENLGNAITLNSTIQNIAKIVGPAIAGILIISIGLAPCFFINAISFIFIISSLLMMNKEELHTRSQITNVKGQLSKGFAYVWNNKIIRDVLIIVTITGILTYNFNVSLALLAKFTFSGDADAFAFLTSSLGIGAVVGGLATARKNKNNPKNVIKVLIYFGIAIILVSISPNLVVAEIGMLVLGFLSISLITTCNTIIQSESSNEMR